MEKKLTKKKRKRISTNFVQRKCLSNFSMNLDTSLVETLRDKVNSDNINNIYLIYI